MYWKMTRTLKKTFSLLISLIKANTILENEIFEFIQELGRLRREFISDVILRNKSRFKARPSAAVLPDICFSIRFNISFRKSSKQLLKQAFRHSIIQTKLTRTNLGHTFLFEKTEKAI